MYVVLYQRGIHNDELVHWFDNEDAAISFGEQIRLSGAHWYVVLRYWPHLTAGFQQLTEWGARK